MTGTHPSIAVVDDDASFLKALRRLLTASGFETHAYASGQEFLDSPDSNIAGCVLLDIQMPGLDGFAVAGELAGRVPFVFMTAHDDAGSRRRAREQGAAGFLRKPASEKKILAAIRIALGSASSGSSLKETTG